MEPIHTFAEVVQHIEQNHSNPTAFNYLENGHWKHIPTEAFIFDLKRLAYGLIDLGLRRGDKVGILANSSPQWNLADFAIIMAGGVTVPLFAKISQDNLIYECAQANIRFIFVQGEEQWQLYEEQRNLFEKVIALDNPKSADGIMKYHEVLQRGEVLWQKKPGLWEELCNQQKADDVATIIYTAGSTGMPKGVELTHLNLCHMISHQVFGWRKSTDSYLSILPLPHVFARQINLILIAWGVSVYYLNDLGKLSEVCQEIKPNLMILVPRLLEKMYDAMEAKIKFSKSRMTRAIGMWALNLAWDSSPSLISKYILRPIADILVYSHMRKSLGDSWRVILCGGAKLNPGLYQFYLNIGFPIFEGWGLTEASTTCVNTPEHLQVGTVGPPLPGVKVKLGENDELLLGGPTVMRGYYRNPDATEAVIDKEGWLHTGDKGVIDEKGFVKIVGRVKEQFKLSTGEYVVPGKIEHALSQHYLIDAAMVIGESKKYPACLLFVDRSGLKRLKKEHNMPDVDDGEFVKSEIVAKEIQKLLDAVNNKVNSWERLAKYQLIVEALSVEGGELTPTLKLKRNVILDKYKGVVNEIYGELAK